MIRRLLLLLLLASGALCAYAAVRPAHRLAAPWRPQIVALPLADARGDPASGIPVLFIGDSNMAGHGQTPGALTPPDAAALDLDLAGHPIVPYSVAIGSTGAQDWLPGKPAPFWLAGAPLLDRAIALARRRHIHLAVVALGTDDVYIDHTLTPAEYGRDVTAIDAALRRAGIVPVWNVPVWLPRTSAPWGAGSQRALGGLVAELHSMASRHRIALGDSRAYAYTRARPGLYTSDHAHLDDAGIAAWGALLARGLLPALG